VSEREARGGVRGFPGWFLTRTYHLYPLPLLSRKLRVVTDWTVALFFRRDIAELGMLEQRRGLTDGSHPPI
jgi:NADH dehydrogenase